MIYALKMQEEILRQESQSSKPLVNSFAQHRSVNTLTYVAAHEYFGNLNKLVENDNTLSHDEKRRKIFELKDADFWFNKAVGSYSAGSLVDSLDFYRQAIVIVPNHVPSLFNMAVIFDQLQQYNNSVRYFSRCSD